MHSNWVVYTVGVDVDAIADASPGRNDASMESAVNWELGVGSWELGNWRTGAGCCSTMLRCASLANQLQSQLLSLLLDPQSATWPVIVRKFGKVLSCDPLPLLFSLSVTNIKLSTFEWITLSVSLNVSCLPWVPFFLNVKSAYVCVSYLSRHYKHIKTKTRA